MKVKSVKIAPKIRIRFTRSWRGYPVGAVINPPGAMRQILLQAKDQLGNKVAEVVDEDPVIAADLPPLDVEDGGEQAHGDVQTNNDVRRSRGRPSKNAVDSARSK